MENIYIVQPDSPLFSVARSFWQIDRHNHSFNKEKIIPKGTVELIFNLYESEGVLASFSSKAYNLPRAFLNGFNTEAVILDLPSHQTFFGILINPVALKYIFKIQAEEYANQCLDMTLVDSSFNSLWNELAEKNNFKERVDVFTYWLSRRLPEVNSQEKALSSFLSSTGIQNLSVPELSSWVCYSSRHLSRKLNEITGMNAEQTILYKKYIGALALIHYSALPLTEIAHECRFSDQSHFIKTFKSFAGITPGEYQRSRSHVIGHLYKEVR